jgi:hypothetical protein
MTTAIEKAHRYNLPNGGNPWRPVAATRSQPRRTAAPIELPPHRTLAQVEEMLMEKIAALFARVGGPSQSGRANLGRSPRQ